MFLRNTASLGRGPVRERSRSLGIEQGQLREPFTSNVPYMHPGVTLDGKGVYDLDEALVPQPCPKRLGSDEGATRGDGSEVPNDPKVKPSGVAALQSVVDKGLAADHIMSAADVRNLDDPNKPQPYVRALPITPEDLAADPPRLRFEVLHTPSWTPRHSLSPPTSCRIEVNAYSWSTTSRTHLQLRCHLLRILGPVPLSNYGAGREIEFDLPSDLMTSEVSADGFVTYSIEMDQRVQGRSVSWRPLRSCPASSPRWTRRWRGPGTAISFQITPSS